MATAERVERRMMLVDVGVEMRNVDVFVEQRKSKG
jgi:hypothetical protein